MPVLPPPGGGGTPGPAGADGADGVDGVDGADGAPGAAGATGATGAAGAAGATGATGPAGPEGGLGQQSTVAPGLPVFAERTQGDFHYDETANTEYVLTGTVGASIVDSFTRADQTGLGTAPGGTAWQVRGGAAADIIGNAASENNGQNYINVAAGDTTMVGNVLAASSGAWEVVLYARLDSTTALSHGIAIGWSSGGQMDYVIYRGGTALAFGALSLGVNFGRTYKVTLSSIGGDIVAIIEDTVTGATNEFNVNDPGAALIGPNCGFRVTGATARLLDFQASNNGSLAWTAI